MILRPTLASDTAALQDIVTATDLFPPEMLADMLAPFLMGDPDHLWLTCEALGQTAGFCYAVPEPLTDGTWNMRAIAVHPDHQSSGRGSALVAALEAALRAAGQRLVIVDTSGTAAYVATRSFYLRSGYESESRIRDFWAPGYDKITFRKAL